MEKVRSPQRTPFQIGDMKDAYTNYGHKYELYVHMYLCFIYGRKKWQTRKICCRRDMVNHARMLPIISGAGFLVIKSIRTKVGQMQLALTHRRRVLPVRDLLYSPQCSLCYVVSGRAASLMFCPMACFRFGVLMLPQRSSDKHLSV